MAVCKSCRKAICVICKIDFVRTSKKQKVYSLSCAGRIKWSKHKSYNDFTTEEKLAYLKRFFEKKVIKKDGCWGWKSAIDPAGYGVMSIESKKRGSHRISWMIHTGNVEIPKGKWVLHKCDNPICTNPEHLYLGTSADNTRDKIQRGRSNIKYGEGRSHSKLNNEKVREIRKAFKDGIHEKELARIYNVHVNTIRDIKMNRTWRSHGSQ